MADSSALDEAFEKAFEHLSECRIAWENDPRDPACIDALGRARAALEDARTAMREERERLGATETRDKRGPDAPHVDADARGQWQGNYPA